jgi:hypothetical protein
LEPKEYMHASEKVHECRYNRRQSWLNIRYIVCITYTVILSRYSAHHFTIHLKVA